MCDEALGRFIHELLDERGLNVVKHGAVVARTRLREAIDRLIEKRDRVQHQMSEATDLLKICLLGQWAWARFQSELKTNQHSKAEEVERFLQEQGIELPNVQHGKESGDAARQKAEGMERAIKETIRAIEAGEKMCTSDSPEALLQGYRQRFGVTFLDMLRESIKDGSFDRRLEQIKLNMQRNKERYERAEQVNEELVSGLEKAGETMRMIRGRCDVSSLQTKEKGEEDWLPVIDKLAISAQAEIKRLLEEDR